MLVVCVLRDNEWGRCAERNKTQQEANKKEKENLRFKNLKNLIPVWYSNLFQKFPCITSCRNPLNCVFFRFLDRSCFAWAAASAAAFLGFDFR